MSVKVFKPQLLTLLPDLGYTGVELLSSYLVALTIEKGDVIVKQGSLDKDVFFPMNGKFSVFEKLKIDDSDVVLQTATFPGPSIVGEVSILTDSERTASVMAMEKADCLILTKKKLDSLILDHPVLMVELQKIFASFLYERQSRMSDKVRNIILTEDESVQSRLDKLGKFTGKATIVTQQFANALFHSA